MVRFWRNVVKGDNESCWNWVGRKDKDGYGRFAFKPKHYLAHKFLYERTKGKVPLGLELDHLCFNRACVNLKHLEPTTGRQNILRGSSPSAVNSRRTKCKNGHPFDLFNTYIATREDGRHRRQCKSCRRIAEEKYRLATSTT
jgi:hypothetical protein